MKRHLISLAAGLVGGLVAVCATQYWYNDARQAAVYDQTPHSRTVSDRTAAPVSNTFDFKKAAKKSTSAVVQIYAAETIEQARRRNAKRRQSNPYYDFFGRDFFGFSDERPKNGSGSGVIISTDGYIVTNNHVVGFADNIKVTLENGKQYTATKVGVDPITDLAVIKIEGEQLPIIYYGDSDQIQIGEWVLAVGNPFSYLTSTVTAGIVSAKGRDLDIIEGGQSIVEFIQTDAAVNPGNSGGALVNIEGELVGINTAIATPTGVYAGYSFAIPSNLVKTIVTSIIENGDIRGNRLGIEGYDVDRALVQEYRLSTESGFMIVSLDKKGNAAKAGVRQGDVIVGINDRQIYDFEDLQSAMAVTTTGESVTIKVMRDDKIKTLSVRLTKNI